MATQSLLQLLPATLILLSVMIIVVILIQKSGDRLWDRKFPEGSTVLLISGFMFIMLLVVHLFQPQDWTSDLLKVLVGVLVGAGSYKLTKREAGSGSSVDISGGQVGGDVAGHDINKAFEHIDRAISEIKDSVVQQHNQIRQFATERGAVDFLIHTLYERGDELAAGFERVAGHWIAKGWKLSFFSSDYRGTDGIFLIFTRPAAGLKPDTKLYYGSEVEGR
jgi:hypothetical protein